MHANSAPSAPLHNLPAALSSFIGRQREIAEILRLLQTERLVTLTGAGGSGKTRLALEVAIQALPSFKDGVRLVEFAPLSDAGLIPQEVASSLAVPEQGGRALEETLVDNLRGRQILLLFDNCEHLVLGCARLAHLLLENCPSLKILATSREPLSIPGEVIRIVPPLSLQYRAGEPALQPGRQQQIFGSEAVQLFAARAQAAARDFQLDQGNAAAVAEICARLDGMPLAIELAAARVRSLSVQQIASYMEDRFELLSGGSRTAPARQRTLEAALDWSYALLSEAERSLLQGLSVFAGGCSLEAAEAVLTDDRMDAGQVRDALARLVDKSLVVVERSADDLRYHLLETIREYARRKLPAARAAPIRDRHLDYFMKWAEDHEPIMLGSDLPLGMQRFMREHDNLRTALDWSQQSPGKAEAGLRLAAAAWDFWRVAGYHTEGRMRLAALLTHKDAKAPTKARATALHRAALHAFYQSDYAACRTLAEQSLEVFRMLGTDGQKGLADSLELLAEVASETGDYATARRLYDEALPIYEKVGDLIGQGDTLKMMGWQAMRSGDYERARFRLEQGLEVCRRSGELRHISSALSGLGELAIRTGRYQEARDFLHESLKISRVTGERWNIAINLGSLGWLASLQKDYDRMAAALRESLTIRMDTGDRSGAAWCLEKLAQAAMLQERPRDAAVVFGAAAALRRPMGSEMDLTDKPEYDSAISRLHSELGAEDFARHWSAGGKMELKDAMEFALGPFEAKAAGSSVEAIPKASGLTARELEVANLIAQGKSNREIAEVMTVGIKTVETYVTRILNKLGFDSRVQVATWVLQQGLSRKETP